MRRDDAPERHLPLAPHDLQILLSVLEGPRHGYSLIKDIEDRTEGDMVLGTSTVYAAVKRMVREGLMEEVAPPDDDPSGGPRRKYYGISAFGKQVAAAEGRRIRRLSEMVAATTLLDGAR